MNKEQLRVRIELRMESIIDDPSIHAQEEYVWLNKLLNDL